MLGFDHGILGSLLIQEWNLSQELEEAVRWHHNFEAAEASNAKVAAMIALGEEIALTSSGADEDADSEDTEETETPEEISDAARYLGVTSARLAELRAQAEQLQIDPHFFT